MTELEVKHYGESIMYAVEQTAIYSRLKGTQVISKLNLGVTLEQYIALDCISNNKDICQRDLAKLILKDRSNTSRILNILEKNKFISRMAETKNNRLVKKIYITEAGQRILDENTEKIREEFIFLFDEFSKEEFAELRALLVKFRNCLVKNTNIQI